MKLKSLDFFSVCFSTTLAYLRSPSRTLICFGADWNPNFIIQHDSNGQPKEPHASKLIHSSLREPMTQKDPTRRHLLVKGMIELRWFHPQFLTLFQVYDSTMDNSRLNDEKKNIFTRVFFGQKRKHKSYLRREKSHIYDELKPIPA